MWDCLERIPSWPCLRRSFILGVHLPFHLLLHVRELPEFALLPGLGGAGERETLGRLLLGSWHALSWSVDWVPILLMMLLFGLLLSIEMLMILLWKCLMILIFGRMVVGRTSL